MDEVEDPVPDPWGLYDVLMRRCLALEEIAERLAATCADPIAVGDWHVWRTGGSTC